MRSPPDLNNVGSKEPTEDSKETSKLLPSQPSTQVLSNHESSESNINNEMQSNNVLSVDGNNNFRQESIQSISSKDVAIDGMTNCPSRHTLSIGLQQKRSSLTQTEVGFIQRLLIDGTEIHIESAIEKLKDDNLFFCDDVESSISVSKHEESNSNILNEAYMDLSRENVEVEPSYEEEIPSIAESTSKVCKGNNKTNKSKVPSTPKISNLRSQSDNTGILSGNIETVIGKNGVIDLQKSTRGNNQDHSQNIKNENYVRESISRNAFRPDQYRGFSKSLPVVTGKSYSSSSSVARSLTLKQRKNSVLHTNLWKAHKTGLAVTPIASNQTLAQTKLIRQVNASSNIALKTINQTRRLSFLNSSELELLEIQKYDDDNPFNAKDRIPYQRQSSNNARDVFRAGSYRRGSFARSSSRLKRASLLMKSERNISITSRTTSANSRYDNDTSVPPPLCVNSKYENKDIKFPPPLCRANRLLSEPDKSHSSIPSIHVANQVGNEDSMSSITANDNCLVTSTAASKYNKKIAPIIRTNSLRQQSAVSQLSSSDSPAKSARKQYDLEASTDGNFKEIDKSLSEKWLFNSLSSVNDHTTEEVGNLVGDNTNYRESQVGKKMMMRQASLGPYGGVGVEIAEISSSTVAEAMLNLNPLEKMTNSLCLVRESSLYQSVDDLMLPQNGFSLLDDEISEVKRSLSSDNLSLSTIAKEKSNFSRSLDLEIDTGGEPKSPDTWKVLSTESADSYGYTYIPFYILGTSVDDVDSHPHVLSPPLMESLQSFLPEKLCDQNFWMRYSLLRDGDSMEKMLRNIRGAEYTILALETTGGEVFGSFTSSPWRKGRNPYGNGEAFLWRMRQSRSVLTNSIIDQAKLESEIDVFLWSGNNYCVQRCTNDMISVGGGGIDSLIENCGGKDADLEKEEKVEFGLGLAIDRSLMHGTSCFCATFDNPPLSIEHQDGSPFEILNLEIWSMTPESTLERAEDLECAKLFLESQLSGNNKNF